MGYIQNDQHFANIVMKILKENLGNFDIEKAVNIRFLIEKVYKASIYGLSDNFTWELRKNPSLIEEDNFWDWYSVNSAIDSLWEEPDQCFLHPESEKRLSSLSGVPGLYCFMSKKLKPIYVGMSKDMKKRVVSSYREKFAGYGKDIYLSLCVCGSESDAAVLEAYFICKMKPPLNRTSKTGEPTIQIVNIPEWENPIPFKIKEI